MSSKITKLDRNFLMNSFLFHLHLRGLDYLLSVLSCAERVGIEICRMTGFISRAWGEIRLFRTEELPV